MTYCFGGCLCFYSGVQLSCFHVIVSLGGDFSVFLCWNCVFSLPSICSLIFWTEGLWFNRASHPNLRAVNLTVAVVFVPAGYICQSLKLYEGKRGQKLVREDRSMSGRVLWSGVPYGILADGVSFVWAQDFLYSWSLQHRDKEEIGL